MFSELIFNTHSHSFCFYCQILFILLHGCTTFHSSIGQPLCFCLLLLWMLSVQASAYRPIWGPVFISLYVSRITMWAPTFDCLESCELSSKAPFCISVGSRVSASLSPCQPWLLAALLTLEGMKLQLTVHFICVFLIMNDIELYFMSQLWIRTLPLPLKKYYVKITKYILLGERKKPENGNLLNNSHYRNLEKTKKVLWRLWLEGKEAKRFRWSPEDS